MGTAVDGFNLKINSAFFKATVPWGLALLSHSNKVPGQASLRAVCMLS